MSFNIAKIIIIGFILWRLFLLIPLYLGSQILEYRPGYEYTNIWKFISKYPPVDNIFLYPWANFDGVHYLLIAGEGYTNNLGFFPLFPFSISTFSNIFGGGITFGVVQFLTGLLATNIFFLASLFIFYLLLRFDYSIRISLITLAFLLVYPTSFFFGAIYSESLFFLTSILALYFARKRLWFLAAIFGLLSSLTRFVGIAIIPAILTEFILQEKITKKSFPKIIPLLFMPLGIISYALYNLNKTGDALYFLHAHGNLGNGRAVDTIISIPQTLYRYIKILLSLPVSQFEWWIALLEFSAFFFASVALYLAWKKKVRISYLVFAFICFLIPTLSGTFTGLPRYTLVLFPIYIALALLSKRIQIAYAAICLILLFILLMFFSKGYFIA